MKKTLLTSIILLITNFNYSKSFKSSPCPTVLDTVQSFCRSTWPGNKIKFLEATDNGGGVAWYSSDTSTIALDPEMDINDGDVYYAGSTDGSCLGNRTAVTVVILDSPNAGKTSFITLDSDGPTVDLRDLISETSRPVDSTGYMLPNTKAGGTIFTPSLDGSWTGRKQLKHYVESTTSCPDDYTIVYLTINPQSNSGYRLIDLGTDEITAKNYLDNNPPQSSEEGSLVNIWLDTPLDTSSVYKIKVSGIFHYYYVNNIYTAPQTTVDLTLTSDTEIEKVDLYPDLQSVTENGSNSSKRIGLNKGMEINQDNLFINGANIYSSIPFEIFSMADSSAVNLQNGSFQISNTLNNSKVKYFYDSDGTLQVINDFDSNNMFSVLSSDTISKSSLSLDVDSNSLIVGKGGEINSTYYFLRKESIAGSNLIKISYEGAGDVSALEIKQDTSVFFTGKLHIGDITNVQEHNLVVSGKMISESLIMKLQMNWPDYVFSEDYDLWPLDTLKKYIIKEKHLPGFPKANVVEKEGLNVGQTSKELLEKIEELTIYAIEIHKSLKAVDTNLIKVNKELGEL